MNLKTILASTALAVVGLTATQAGWAQTWNEISPEIRQQGAHNICSKRSYNQWQYDQCMAQQSRAHSAADRLTNGGPMTLQDIMDLDALINFN